MHALIIVNLILLCTEPCGWLVDMGLISNSIVKPFVTPIPRLESESDEWKMS